ncbi:MAG TPA: ABC transporter ATP-binding protein [Planctomycetota bacterium]|nr:ABC transporter ATP-binding protein [Planctomycetota bacterium]HRR81982.1 ABC transporter ATP-binding protein [Planctomycetota bacterium]HRT97058.1 ABC transporter ATP-binding protein [Planctomycetota bacterium]
MPSSASDNVVQTAKLTKVFRDFWRRPKVRAVDQLDFEVRRGEVFGLLGPNGSGKSTTIKILLGLLFPTSGSVRILGRPPRDVRVKARLGFLPEESYLYPYLNAPETLDFFGRLSGLSRHERRRRVGALIEMVGLSTARNRPLREYSKGMARRIGLAQALINDPELLLLDEPTTGLDPIGAREVKDLILELKSRGKTILLCSHLLAHAEDVCDRVGILYGGRLCVVGPVGDLLAQQQLTQITLPSLPPAAFDRVRAVLDEVAEPGTVTVGHPVDRLETYFLRVIEEARQVRPETGGAGAGRFEPSLFRKLEPASPAEVIERLTQPAPEPSPAPPEPEPVPAEPATAAPSRVLERLVEPHEAPAPRRPEAPEAVEPPAEAGAPERRSVIDRLVKKPSPGQEDQKPPSQ